MRKTMVEKTGSTLSVRRQCQLLKINRNRLETKPRQAQTLSPGELEIARRVDELYLRCPEFGARRMSWVLRREGHPVSRRQAARIMRVMGLSAIYRRPRTSRPGEGAGHKIYPYLLRDKEIRRPDEAWCADITYIPMPRGFAYLVAVMDWHTRAVLGWRLSNTMDERFCVEALEEAVRTAGRAPDIINTDQGSQFTGEAWRGAVEAAGAEISMDGKGRWMDNVFIERLWRSVKHEGVYLWAYQDLHEVETALGEWFATYNHFKPHQSLPQKQTPWQYYRPDQADAGLERACPSSGIVANSTTNSHSTHKAA